jgi:hypothetical protein
MKRFEDKTILVTGAGSGRCVAAVRNSAGVATPPYQTNRRAAHGGKGSLRCADRLEVHVRDGRTAAIPATGAPEAPGRRPLSSRFASSSRRASR